MKMSMAVDTIFAREVLAAYLQKMGRQFLLYDTFFDVIEAVRNSPAF